MILREYEKQREKGAVRGGGAGILYFVVLCCFRLVITCKGIL